jgi:PIN domain nuclease of toxin-antitoxin system
MRWWRSEATRLSVSDAVLDASAVLALLQDEPGSDRVLESLPGALICSVNLSEVVAKLTELGMPETDIRLALSLGLEVVAFDEALAYSAGALRPVTRSAGLSLGDRACLAIALARSLPALTTDRAWRDLDIDATVEVIRPD